jgi:hypothetical protein
MTQCAIQYVTSINPGADIAAFKANVQNSVNIWRKHGADPTVWAVSAGEIGNWVFSVVFESFDAYGKCMNALNSDPEFQKWQLESTKAGLATRVRNNLIRKVDMA